MPKTIKIIKQGQQHITQLLDTKLETDMLFREIQKDTIGKSGSSPTWGYVYQNRNRNGKLKYKGIGLYKEYDYDAPHAAYAEKVWSIIGKPILKDSRVPDIDMVEEQKGETGIISYRLLDNDREDLIHIRDILFNKFQRADFKEQKDIFNIEDLIECIEMQIEDRENFINVRRQVLHTLLLDAITNNGDRHGNNWALIRDKETNQYKLADFDHSSSFTDMFTERKFCTLNGWVTSYIATTPGRSKFMMGNCGKEIIEYISKNYRKEFEEFSSIFDQNLDSIIEEIEGEELDIDKRRLTQKLRKRNGLLKEIISREEQEYER